MHIYRLKDRNDGKKTDEDKVERFSEGERIKCTEKKIHFPENCLFFGNPRKKMKDPEKI